jgi:predicted nuclease with TOPRIM domain
MSEDRTQQLPNDALRQILARFDSMDARFDSFETRLTALEEKVDRRLQETRPIWEQVLDRLTKVETRLKKVEDEVFMFRRKFDVWTGDLTLLQQRYEDIEERFAEFKAERSK